MGKIGRGRPLRSQTKEIIINVRSYFERERDLDRSLRPFKQLQERVADAVGLSLNAVRKVCREADDARAAGRPFSPGTPGKKRPREAPVKNPDSFALAAIRRRVHRFYEEGQFPTLHKLWVALKKEQDDDAPIFNGCKGSLRLLLVHHLGFRFMKLDHRRHLIERPDVVALRHQFLSEVRKADFTKIIFLDETWVNENHSLSRCWQSNDCTGLKVPLGKGKRLILLHAGSSQGFVSGGLLLFRSKSGKADYHEDMNAECFTDWFKNQLLPNIPYSSVIVMDNAPYHSVQKDKPPTMKNKKGDLQEWLARNGISYSTEMLKAELYEVVKANKPRTKRYVIDELAAQPPYYHKVIRLPPYHCQFNPIERIWAHVKREVAARNRTFKISDVEILTREVIQGITSETWEKCVAHVKKDVEDYWVKDGLIENQIEKFIISANSNSDDSELSENCCSSDEGSDVESPLSYSH